MAGHTSITGPSPLLPPPPLRPLPFFSCTFGPFPRKAFATSETTLITKAPQNADQMAAVMAEIQALQNGGGSPMEQDALLQLLGAV